MSETAPEDGIQVTLTIPAIYLQKINSVMNACNLKNRAEFYEEASAMIVFYVEQAIQNGGKPGLINEQIEKANPVEFACLEIARGKYFTAQAQPQPAKAKHVFTVVK